MRVALEAGLLAAAPEVPEAHGLVPRAAREGLAIGAEGDGVNPESVWPSRRACSRPLARSQRRTVLSDEPLARVLPSGLKATEVTFDFGSAGRKRVCSRALARSQRRTIYRKTK